MAALQYSFDSDDFLDSIFEDEVEEEETPARPLPFALRIDDDFVPNELLPGEETAWWRALVKPETLAWLRDKDVIDRGRRVEEGLVQAQKPNRL